VRGGSSSDPGDDPPRVPAHRRALVRVRAARAGANVGRMSEETTGYDPDQDPDADPANLNPRTGAAAQGGADQDADTDAEPANLNPRDDA